MTDNTRLITAARAVIAAEDMKKPLHLTVNAWLRWEAEKLEAQESAMQELRASLTALDTGDAA